MDRILMATALEQSGFSVSPSADGIATQLGNHVRKKRSLNNANIICMASPFISSRDATHDSSPFSSRFEFSQMVGYPTMGSLKPSSNTQTKRDCDGYKMKLRIHNATISLLLMLLLCPGAIAVPLSLLSSSQQEAQEGGEMRLQNSKVVTVKHNRSKKRREEHQKRARENIARNLSIKSVSFSGSSSSSSGITTSSISIKSRSGRTAVPSTSSNPTPTPTRNPSENPTLSVQPTLSQRPTNFPTVTPNPTLTSISTSISSSIKSSSSSVGSISSSRTVTKSSKRNRLLYSSDRGEEDLKPKMTPILAGEIRKKKRVIDNGVGIRV